MDGNKRADIASKLRKKKESLIGTVLLGYNAVNIAASAIATSLAINQFFAASARIRKHYHTVEVVSGVLLVVVGVLIFTNRLTIIANYLSPYFPTF